MTPSPVTVASKVDFGGPDAGDRLNLDMSSNFRPPSPQVAVALAAEAGR